MENDVPLKVLKEILGHTDIRVTDRLYSKLRDDKQREAVGMLQKSSKNILAGDNETRYITPVKPATPIQDHTTPRRPNEPAGFTNRSRDGARSSGPVSLTGAETPGFSVVITALTEAGLLAIAASRSSSQSSSQTSPPWAGDPVTEL